MVTHLHVNGGRLSGIWKEWRRGVIHGALDWKVDGRRTEGPDFIYFGGYCGHWANKDFFL
ncbi:MAG: hypothetical protein ACYSUC_02555 [Planctomycetota bacterium]|jgi:hypothetical protein